MAHLKPSPLRIRRWASGLRITDIAKATGLSATRISEIERGEGRLATPWERSLLDQALLAVAPKGGADVA